MGNCFVQFLPCVHSARAVTARHPNHRQFSHHSAANLELLTGKFANDDPSAEDLAITTLVDALEIQLDTSLSVAAIRQQIAFALNTSDNLVGIVGSDRGVVSDLVALNSLRFSELRVVVKVQTIKLAPCESEVVASPTGKALAASKLFKELRAFDDDAPCGFTAEVADPSAEDSIFCWRVCFPWPESMQNRAGRCETIMRFPFAYPSSPPEVYFVAEVQHWAVAPSGKALMDILDENWSPALSACGVACSLLSVLNDTPDF